MNETGAAYRLRASAGLLGFVAVGYLLFAGIFALMDLAKHAPTRRVVIGSKAFTESILLAEIMGQLIERNTSLKVELKTNLGGTQICFNALKSGSVDLYPEYTGTGLVAILGEPADTDRTRVLASVRRVFSQRYQLLWLDPMAFNNTYALAMRADRARALSIESISDLARHPELKAGFTAEFMARKDGYPGLRKLYGLEFSSEPVSMEAGLMYGATTSSQVDVISAYATDGRIAKLGLFVLDDDKRFFPPYQAAPLVRAELLARFPELRGALAILAGKIDDERMQQLNAAVDIEGKRPEDVAKSYVDELMGKP